MGRSNSALVRAEGQDSLCLEPSVSVCGDNAGRERLIFLVPEQSRLPDGTGVDRVSDSAGLQRCDVLSFRRLAHRVFYGNRMAIGLGRTMGRLMAM
jgi:hypothetical protein